MARCAYKLSIHIKHADELGKETSEESGYIRKSARSAGEELVHLLTLILKNRRPNETIDCIAHLYVYFQWLCRFTHGYEGTGT